MSSIEVNINNDLLIIKKNNSRTDYENIETINLSHLEYGKIYTSKIKLTNSENKNKIMFIKDICLSRNVCSLNTIVAVYSTKKAIKYTYCSKSTLYKNLVDLKYKVLSLKLTRKNLKIVMCSYILNKYGLNIEDIKLYVDENKFINSNLMQYKKELSKFDMLKKKNIHFYKFKIKDILNDDSIINGVIRYVFKVNGVDVDYRIGIKNKKEKNKRYYYIPINGIFVKDYAIHIRRTEKSYLTFVKRKKEPIENTLRYRLLENKFISCILYNIGFFMRKIRKKKINVYYEKFASKAEEGVFDLFLLTKNGQCNSKNYYVIDKNSIDYDKIKRYNGVVKKYSFKYYWIIYNATNLISTEAPIHLNILRSNNKYLRKALIDKCFVFLQHGVTYMKCHGKNSAFRKNKEAEVSYIVAGSEKEADVVVDMLKIDEQQVLKTGLPIFSKVKYNHINNDSDDFITIMFTWKPYEEQLYDFERSSYYKNIVEICNMLNKYTNNIIVIAHPKIYDLLKNTKFENNLWDKPISEALEKTKLLITDYSSVCYNSFYQGSGVVFYQPDLELYEKENGKLIPQNDEYIGRRAFSLNELEDIIKKAIYNKKINLDFLRTKKFKDNYNLINEFSDGNNIERIYQELIKLKLI